MHTNGARIDEEDPEGASLKRRAALYGRENLSEGERWRLDATERNDQKRAFKREQREQREQRERQQVAANVKPAMDMAPWVQWSKEIGTRLVALETRLQVWVGDPDASIDEDQPPLILNLFDEIRNEIQKALDSRSEAIQALRKEIDTRFAALDAIVRELPKMREQVGKLDEGVRDAVALAKAIETVEEKLTVEIACTRDELMARVDAKQYGLTILPEFDAQAAPKAIAELRRSTREEFNQLMGALNAMHERVGEIEGRKRDIKLLASKVAILEKGLPKPAPPAIASWRLDAANYIAVPVLSDGKDGPALELRALFERYNDETRT